jgi:hypothetical protein
VRVNAVLNYCLRSAWQLSKGLLWMNWQVQRSGPGPDKRRQSSSPATALWVEPVAYPPRERSFWARIGPRASPSIFSGIADKAASSSGPPRLRSALGFTRDRSLPFGSSAPFCRERLACGLDAITISGRLGHGSLAIMLRVHGHWFPNERYRLQGSWRRALPKAPNQSGYGSGSQIARADDMLEVFVASC